MASTAPDALNDPVASAAPRRLGTPARATKAGRLVASLAALACGLALASAAHAQSTAEPAKPAPAAAAVAAAAQPGSAPAVALPRPDESNAERARSQPGNNAPFWRAVRNSGDQSGITNLPGLETGVLVQPFVQYPGSRVTSAGEAWRQVRNNWIIPYGGALLFITVLALALFYWKRGSLGGHVPDTGRKIERFTPFERAAHWSNAGAFVVLAISGIVMAFGKFFLLPILGGTLFGWLTYALKNAHNFVGPLFVVSLVIVVITFIKDNLPHAGDLTWLKRGGGMFGGEEVPSHRFNAGEKGVFWAGVCLLGGVVVVSGLVLDQLLPVAAYTRGNMQVAHMVHAVAALLMMTVILGHIYMGTIGMKGALDAMKTGYVDEGWAKEHHALWHNDIQAGKIPAQRSKPADGLAASTPPARA